MAIRPIDMQTLIPKMEKMDAARNKTINRTDNDLQQNQMQTKIDSQLKPNQVNELEKKDHNALKNDEDKNSNKHFKQNSSQHQTDDEEQNDKKQKKTKKIVRGHFDMKV